METFELSKDKIQEIYSQLNMLLESHKKNLDQLKYNLPYKLALQKEIKKVTILKQELQDLVSL